MCAKLRVLRTGYMYISTLASNDGSDELYLVDIGYIKDTSDGEGIVGEQNGDLLMLFYWEESTGREMHMVLEGESEPYYMPQEKLHVAYDSSIDIQKGDTITRRNDMHVYHIGEKYRELNRKNNRDFFDPDQKAVEKFEEAI